MTREEVIKKIAIMDSSIKKNDWNALYNAVMEIHEFLDKYEDSEELLPTIYNGTNDIIWHLSRMREASANIVNAIYDYDFEEQLPYGRRSAEHLARLHDELEYNNVIVQVYGWAIPEYIEVAEPDMKIINSSIKQIEEYFRKIKVYEVFDV